MRCRAPVLLFLALLCSASAAWSADLTIHLDGGATVSVPAEELLRLVITGTSTGVEDPAGSGTPTAFRVLGNHPNPFNPSTTIRYEIAEAAADVRVRVYSLDGSLVKELVHETQSAGSHQVTWDGTGADQARVASGVYLYVVQSRTQIASRQMILVK